MTPEEIEYQTLQANSRQVIAALSGDIHRLSVQKGFWPLDHESVIRPGDVVSCIPSEKSSAAQADACHFIRNFGEALMLVNTELAEAMEGFRQGIELDDPKEGAMVEMADAVIRLFDLGYGIGGEKFAKLLVDKIKINVKRPELHGKKF